MPAVPGEAWDVPCASSAASCPCLEEELREFSHSWGIKGLTWLYLWNPHSVEYLLHAFMSDYVNEQLNTWLNHIFILLLMGSLIFFLTVSLDESEEAWPTFFHPTFKGKMNDLTNVKLHLTWFFKAARYAISLWNNITWNSLLQRELSPKQEGICFCQQIYIDTGWIWPSKGQINQINLLDKPEQVFSFSA